MMRDIEWSFPPVAHIVADLDDIEAQEAACELPGFAPADTSSRGRAPSGSFAVPAGTILGYVTGT